ncbi:methyl-accepting chemotaxis protein [Paenibacillus paridis]|uniref:methyl-accepting chemotaxis protein n=1 Tax=Paenibacillus paridis TaxID=2583376 RepID=UPI00111F6B3D|nr:methyl-accepting chemotaxis protein [Paenibacillus paridis]
MKNMKVSRKIAMIVAAALFFIIAVGAGGNLSIRQMANLSNDLYDDSLLPLSWIKQVSANDYKHNALFLEFMFNEDNTRIDSLVEQIHSNSDASSSLLQQYRSTTRTNNETALLKEYDGLLAQYNEQEQQIVDLMMNGKVNEAYTLYTGQTAGLRASMTELLTKLANSAEETAASMNQASETRAANSNLITLLGTLAALLLLIPIAIVITKMITKPVISLQHLMKEAEHGNLTVEGSYFSQDEIGQLTKSFNTMIGGIHALLQQVSQSAQTLTASSEELTASVHQTSGAAEQMAGEASGLAAGFEQQTETINSLSSAADHMVSQLSYVERIGKEMKLLAHDAELANHTGADAASQIHEQMLEIKQNVEETEADINALYEASSTIGSIVTAINEIAGQTNLLSLNASIEAARAGDAGRGFTVVASEIRKLADDSAASSRQIAELVAHMQAKTEAAVHSMRKGAERVEAGMQRSLHASASFVQIEASISKTVDKVNETEAAITQAAGESRSVSSSMIMVNRITNEGSGRIQEISAASEEQAAVMEDVLHSAHSLAELADDLHASLARFTL